jgi:hypothetical protein
MLQSTESLVAVHGESRSARFSSDSIGTESRKDAEALCSDTASESGSSSMKSLNRTFFIHFRPESWDRTEDLACRMQTHPGVVFLQKTWPALSS